MSSLRIMILTAFGLGMPAAIAQHVYSVGAYSAGRTYHFDCSRGPLTITEYDVALDSDGREIVRVSDHRRTRFTVISLGSFRAKIPLRFSVVMALAFLCVFGIAIFLHVFRRCLSATSGATE